MPRPRSRRSLFARSLLAIVVLVPLLAAAALRANAFLLAQVHAVVADMTRHGPRPLAQATWGEVNPSHVAHPLSRALPVLAWFLDMPHVALPSFGQSERLVVAPGHEERASLSMPGGQSGHPMSPFYGAGHDDWVAGRPTPLLLAGRALHLLALTP